MDFQVNNETYFLSLAENERQWRLFVATENGARAVPVYIDAPAFDNVEIMIEDEATRTIVN